MEQILPGVSIEVRPEGLITPGQVSISTIGIVGTANRGPVRDPEIIGGAPDARRVFGEADAYDRTNAGNELTLVRALEIAFDHGARDVIAVRVANGAATAGFVLQSAGGDCCTLEASSPGTWGNDLGINISPADENAIINNERHPGVGPVTLTYTEIVESARTRISVLASGSSVPAEFTPIFTGPAGPCEVLINNATGVLTFDAAEVPGAADTVVATYVVLAANAVKVTLGHDLDEEVYTVVSGQHLVDLLAGSSLAGLVDTAPNPNIGELPTAFAATSEVQLFGGGTNGVTGAVYTEGLDDILDQNAHIIVAAGQDQSTIGASLTAHVSQASSDLNKRERIGIVGSGAGASPTFPGENLDDVLGHALNSDRIVFVAPGIMVPDRASGAQVTLPGSYAAVAIAGTIAGFPVHRSLTNKRLSVAGLEQTYSPAQLRQLVLARVLALEEKFGFRVVKGITTSTNTAWHQITTRRIVDKAKFGVRSAANPYIGLLNNSRVRTALQATIDSFLSEMVLAEELVSYDLNVTATRPDEIRGIVRVTMTLRPVFSIDFIKVTMFLE